MNQIKKTSPFAQALIDNLSPYLTFDTHPAGAKFKLVENGVRMCHFMRDGILMLYRGDDEQLLMGTLGPPFISGLGDFNEDVSSLMLITAQPCEIAVLTREMTFEIIEQKDLWKLVAQQMQHVSGQLLKYSAQFAAPSAYEAICHQLRLLINEPPSLRKEITAEKYIRSKVPLSRSGTMRILSDLKTGGYIVIEDGILIEIRHLPAKY
ncbi:helix-turn-helix domain-containing protein [Pseudescherichia vulneris]